MRRPTFQPVEIPTPQSYNSYMNSKDELKALLQEMILPEIDSIKSKIESSKSMLDKQMELIDKMEEKIDSLIKSSRD